MARDIEFNSYSHHTGVKNNMDWYEWCAFVGGPEELMDEIDEVWYVLDPTYPDPERTVRDAKSRFAIYSAGWGSFDLEIKVVFKDRSSQWQDYRLELVEDNWPKKQLDSPVTKTTRAVYDVLFHQRYRWRKLTTIVAETGLELGETEQILAELADDNLARTAYFRSPDQVPMWGATAVLGIAPRVE